MKIKDKRIKLVRDQVEKAKRSGPVGQVFHTA